MFSYSCPSCAQKLLAPPERAGQRTICPKCLKPLTIPNPSRADDDDLDDPHAHLLHAGPLVDDDAPTHPTGPPRGPDPTPTPRVLLPDPEPATRVQYDPAPTPPRPPRAVPRPEPVAALRPEPVAARAATATATPPAVPPRPPARVTTAVPTRPARPAAEPGDGGRVQFAPTGMAGVDLAAGLAADLTMRMRPPPEPSADLMLTTLVWAGLTGLAGVLWVAGVVYDPAALPFVALIGALLAAVGYLWAGYLAGQTDPLKGFITLLPPVAAVRLLRPFGANGYRPLRYVLTGALLLGLYVVSPAARAAVQTALDRLQPAPPPLPAAPASPADKLRTLAGQKSPDRLVAALAELAQPEAVQATAAEARPELAAELVKLCDPAREPRSEVRAAALPALAAWQPDATRGPVRAALRSPDAAERRAGLQLAARWADPETAGLVAARLSDRQESADAQKALRAMGPAAEPALLPLLRADTRAAALLVVMELLEAGGGPPAVAALRELEGSDAASPSVREEAKVRADALEKRLAKK